MSGNAYKVQIAKTAVKRADHAAPRGFEDGLPDYPIRASIWII